MSDLLRKISGGSRKSFESAETHTSDDVVDTASEPLAAAIADADDVVDEVNQNIAVADSLESLVSKTLAVYGSNGMDEQAAELYRISVESILIASRMDIPSKIIVPTFESGMRFIDYSAEAEEKSKNVIRRIYEYIVNALKRFWKVLVNLKDRVKERLFGIKKKADQLKEKAETVEESGKVEAHDITVSEKTGTFVAGMGGVVSFDKLHESISVIHAVMNTCIDMSEDVGFSGAATKATMSSVMKKTAGFIDKLKHHKLSSAHTLELTYTNDKIPTVGLSASIKFTGTPVTKMKSLTPTEVRDLAIILSKEGSGTTIVGVMEEMIRLNKKHENTYTEDKVKLFVEDASITDSDIREYTKFILSVSSSQVSIFTKLVTYMTELLQSVNEVCDKSLEAERAANAKA